MTQFIHISSIKVPPRQRSEISRPALDQLKQSIVEDGLFHAIVLRDGDTLVAGERRLRAMSELHSENKNFCYNDEVVQLNNIPIIHISSSSEIAALQMELNENLMREELSWQDRTKALSELHRLRCAQIGHDDKLTFTATAKEVISQTNSTSATDSVAAEISRAMLTADFMDDEDVKKARNEREAFNIASRKIRAEFATALAQRNKSKHTFIHGDCSRELSKLTNHFSCFVADPPYGISTEKFGNAAIARHEYEDSQEYAYTLSEEILKECFKLGTDDAHIWLFCDLDYFVDMKQIATLYGWQVLRTPIIWNSGTSGHIPDQRISVRRNYEAILFAHKGNKGLAYVLDDVINGITSKGAESGHGAQKPSKLYELLLKLSALPGDNVLDPCCGAGTIFAAADALNMNATGIEFEDEYAKLNIALIGELIGEVK